VSVNRDVFAPERDFNYDFQLDGRPMSGGSEAAQVPGALALTHCCFCGCQCGMYLRVEDGQVVGVEPRDYAHNRGELCPKDIVAYQQAGYPDRLRYPLIRRGGKGGALERATWEEAHDYIVSRWKRIQAEHGRDAIAVYSGDRFHPYDYRQLQFLRAVR